MKNTLIEKEDRATVRVGWLEKADLGTLECEVIERRGHQAYRVTWANGNPARVTWCGSRGHYVFKITKKAKCGGCGHPRTSHEKFHGDNGCYHTLGCICLEFKKADALKQMEQEDTQ